MSLEASRESKKRSHAPHLSLDEDGKAQKKRKLEGKSTQASASLNDGDDDGKLRLLFYP